MTVRELIRELEELKQPEAVVRIQVEAPEDHMDSHDELTIVSVMSEHPKVVWLEAE